MDYVFTYECLIKLPPPPLPPHHHHHHYIRRYFTCIFFNRPILLKTGVFDQVRVDMGKEWVLILFIQELLSGFRENMDRPAHVKTTSKKNLTIERIWPEVNSRVNYPIKRVLVDLEEKGILDMTNENVQFCVSWFTCGVAKVGMKRFVDAWNRHRIKGKKTVPAVYCRNIYRPGVITVNVFKQRRTRAELSHRRTEGNVSAVCTPSQVNAFILGPSIILSWPLVLSQRLVAIGGRTSTETAVSEVKMSRQTTLGRFGFEKSIWHRNNVMETKACTRFSLNWVKDNKV